MRQAGSGEVMARIWANSAWAREHIRRAEFYNKQAESKLEESRQTIRGIIWPEEFARLSAAHTDSNWDGILLVY